MSLVYSRRDFGRLALAAMPAAALAGRFRSGLPFQAKPDSLWGGVPFGIFAPYRFGPEASDLEGALNTLVKLGVSYTELGNAVVERYVGAPQAAGGRGGGAGQAPAAANAGAAASARARDDPLRRRGAVGCRGGSGRRRTRSTVAGTAGGGAHTGRGARGVACIGADEQVQRRPEEVC